MTKGKKVMLLLAIIASFVVGMVTFATNSAKVRMEDYFQVNGAQVSVQSQSVDFIMEGETATVTFVKPLASDGFSLSFAGVDNNTMQQVDFVLTDSANDKSSTKLNFIRMNDTYTAVALNDSERSYITNGSMYRNNDTDFYFTYNADSQVFTDSASYTIPVSANTDGNAFDGFATQMVNLTVVLHGEKGSVFRLKEMNRQRLGSEYETDNVEPIITLTNNVAEARKGSVIKIPTAFATDVLSDTATVKMSVLSPDGNVVKAADGTKLKDVTPDKAYEITIDSYGDYRLEYQATDGKNTTRTVSSQIHVVDDSKPTLTLSEAFPEVAKINDEISLPQLTGKDNVTKEENLVTWVTVKYPSGKICGMKETIVLEEEGQYQFSFHVMDEEGNIRRTIQKIYVEGE